MKRFVIAVSALAMVAWLSSSVMAQGPRGGGKGRPGGFQRGGPGGGSEEGSSGQRRPDPEQIFRFFDKDGDGKLTKEELPGPAQAHFSEIDADGDGAVSKAEFVEAAKKMGGQRPGGPGGPDPQQMFQRFDKNSDGKLTKDEVPEQAWERIGKADKDGDGVVTKEEFVEAAKKMMEGRGGPGQMFQRLDKNGDGELTKDEVPAQFWERIKNADTDGNGSVSQEEMQKAMPQQRPSHHGGRGGPQGRPPQGGGGEEGSR